MKKHYLYILIIVIIIALIYYFTQFPSSTKSLVNEVTLVEQNTKTLHADALEKPDDTPKPSKPDPEISLSEMSNQENDEKEISYLAAYRELVQYNRCMMINHRRQSGDDLIADYIKEYDRFAENPMKPSEVQIYYYKRQIDSCVSILINEKEQYRDGLIRLTKRLKNITPETDEEIALSQALEINKKLEQISNQLYKEKIGYDQVTDEQREANVKKKLTLYKEIDHIRERNDGNTTDEDDQLIAQIYEQIAILNKTPDFEINTEEIAFLENEYTNNALELKEFFQINQSPDIFLIFAEHLLNERMGKFFFTEDLNNKLGIYDTVYIENLSKHVVPFVACTLDYPCGPESYFSINHCIHPGGNEAKACGKNVIDFYLDDLISTNQMIDFNNYFNYLLDNHAKL